jgi:hypothetical protein
MSRLQLGSETSITVHIAIESSFASKDPLSQAAHPRAAAISSAMRADHNSLEMPLTWNNCANSI